MSPIGCERRRGFAMLPVVLALSLLAATAYLMTRESASGVALVASAQQTERARYVAEAALRHATWQAQAAGCDGYSDVATTSFGADSYDASVAPTSGSPITVAATGTLADGTTYTLTSAGEPVYETPTSVVLQPDAAHGKDAWFSSSQMDWNYGAADTIKAQENAGQRSLIEFELDDVPTGTRVVDATLELYADRVHSPGSVLLYRVTSPWVEGTCQGSGCTSDGATWNTSDGVTSWASPGADHEPDPVSSQAVSSVGWVAWNVTSVVAAWLDGTPNHGLLFVGSPPADPDFWSSDHVGASLRPKLTITYACECGQVCGAGGEPKRVLYVVGDPAKLSAQESARRALLGSWGFFVTLIDDDADEKKFYIEAAVNDAAYVSQEAIATALGSKLNDSLIGVVNESKDMIDDFGFAKGLSMGGGLPTLNVDPNHYITSVFESSPVAPYVANDWYQLAAEPVAAGVDPVGTWVEAPWMGKPALMALPPGADLIGGGAAAGRRVQIPWGSGQGATPVALDSLSDDARTIIKRSIEWAGGAGCDSLKRLLLLVDDASNPTPQEIARQTLLESWCFAVEFFAAAEPVGQYNLVAPGFDVVYVPSTVYFADVMGKLQLLPVGVVNEVSALTAYLGFTSGSGGSSGTQTEIVDNAHVITSPFSTGNLTVTSSSQSLHRFVNTMGPGFHTLSTTTWSEDPMLMTLDEGDELVFGGKAPDRRVMLPWGSSSFDFNALNADGQALLLRALEWAAGILNADRGPIAHWKLDETSDKTAVDSAGGHDGTLTNGPIWSPGTIDGGLSVDGSNDFVDVPHDDTLSLTTFSISAWVYPTALSGWQMIMAKGATVSTSNYYLGALGDEIGFGFYNSGWVDFATTTANLSTNRWYHVTATFDDSIGEGKIYLDGIPLDTGTTTKSPLPNGDALGIGRSEVGEYWPGMLDDVRIYDLVLSVDEVTVLAGMGDSVCDGTFRDEFNAQSFSGDDGTLSWAGDWKEVGESDGPTSGDVRVDYDESNYQLRIRDNDNGGEGVEREADLSGAGAATLFFDYRRDGLDVAADYVTADVSDDGGATWTELDRFEGEGNGTEDPTYQSRSYDITKFRAPNTRIRFQSSPGLGGQDAVWFDNVEICVGQ